MTRNRESLVVVADWTVKIAPHSEIVAAIGSRGTDPSDVAYGLSGDAHGMSVLVSGGARGADQAAEEWAAGIGMRVVSFRPKRGAAGPYIVEKWEDGQNLGPVYDRGEPITFPDFRAAALKRNWWIVGAASRVSAYWDGMSTGTAHGIAAATRIGCELRIWMKGDS